MNCRPDDIAIITIRCENKANWHKLVKVERPAFFEPGKWEVVALQELQALHTHGNYLVKVPAGSRGIICDTTLRPLRGDPGTDEVIRRIGLPRPLHHPNTNPV